MYTRDDYKRTVIDGAEVIGFSALAVGACYAESVCKCVENTCKGVGVIAAAAVGTAYTIGKLGHMTGSNIVEGIKDGKPKDFIEKVAEYKAGV